MCNRSQTVSVKSGDFDYLFIACHYMLMDAFGYYDMAMVNNLLPLMKQYNVQARDPRTGRPNRLIFGPCPARFWFIDP